MKNLKKLTAITLAACTIVGGMSAGTGNIVYASADAGVSGDYEGEWDEPWDYTDVTAEQSYHDEDKSFQDKLGVEDATRVTVSSGMILGMKESSGKTLIYCSDNNILVLDDATLVSMDDKEISPQALEVGYRISYSSDLVQPSMPGYAYNVKKIIARSVNGNITQTKSVTDSAISYNLYENGSVYIWGDGQIGADLLENKGQIKDIYILPGITAVEKNAFEGCVLMASISIPSTVTNLSADNTTKEAVATDNTTGEAVETDKVTDEAVITDNPFKGFSNLEKIIVASENPVYECEKNFNVIVDKENKVLITGCNTSTIPLRVKKIGCNAFYGCSTMTDVNLPEGLEEIEDNAFYGCKGLTTIEVPAYVKKISDNAFAGCNNVNLYLHNAESVNLNAVNVCYTIAEPNKCYPRKHGIKMIKGDFDGDNKLELTDVTLALKIALGIEELTPERLMYVNSSEGKLTLSDVTQYLKVSLGIETESVFNSYANIPVSYSSVTNIYDYGKVTAFTDVVAGDEIKELNENIYEATPYIEDAKMNVEKIISTDKLSMRQKLAVMEVFDVPQEDLGKYTYYRVTVASGIEVLNESMKLWIETVDGNKQLKIDLGATEESKNDKSEIFYIKAELN